MNNAEKETARDRLVLRQEKEDRVMRLVFEFTESGKLLKMEEAK